MIRLEISLPCILAVTTSIAVATDLFSKGHASTSLPSNVPAFIASLFPLRSQLVVNPHEDNSVRSHPKIMLLAQKMILKTSSEKAEPATLAMAIFFLFILTSHGAAGPLARALNQSIYRRPFEAQDIMIGQFLKLDNRVPIRNCPSISVKYTHIIAKGDGTYRVPHSRIYMNGMKCGNLPDSATEDDLWVDNHMELFPVDFVLNESISIQKGTNAAWVKLNTQLHALAFFNFSASERLQNPALSQTWIGFERWGPRVCNNSDGLEIVTQQYAFVFFGKNDDIRVDITKLVPEVTEGSILLDKIHPYHVTFQMLPQGETTVEVLCPQLFVDRTVRDEEGSVRKCFPSRATVQTPAGLLRMDELRIGDCVADGSSTCSPVFFFSHRHRDAVSSFVTLRTLQNSSLTLSAGHYVYTAKGMKTASLLRVGDELLVSEGLGVVAKMEWEWQQGLFNPHTLSGQIVVDGIVASVYTDAVQPCLAHSLLTPVRAIFRAGRWSEKLPEILGKVMERREDSVRVIRAEKIVIFGRGARMASFAQWSDVSRMLFG